MIEIPPHTQARLLTLAAKRGQPIEEYVSYIIEREVRAEEPIDAILLPFHRGWEESGMSEQEIAALLDAELKTVRYEKKVGQ